MDFAHANDELDHEQLYLLFAIRYWCAGRPTCDQRTLERVAELLDAIGAKPAIASFSAMMNALWSARELQIHAPHCKCFSEDERALLALIETGRRGHVHDARRQASALAPAPLDGYVVEAALSVGMRLQNAPHATMH
jgi:hypothetical protein